MASVRPDLDPELRTLLADLPLVSELTTEVLAQLRQYPSPPVDAVLDGRAVDHRELTIDAADGVPIPPARAGGHRHHPGRRLLPGSGVDRRPCRRARHGSGPHRGRGRQRRWRPGRRGHPAGPRPRRPGHRRPGADLPHARPPQQHHLEPPVRRRARGLDPRDEPVRLGRGARRPPRRRGVRLCLPGRAADLAGLPTTYVDAGTAEVFRDEAVAYATRIWAAGGQAELHIWAGGCHGFDALYPKAQVSVTARQTRNDWLLRTLR